MLLQKLVALLLFIDELNAFRMINAARPSVGMKRLYEGTSSSAAALLSAIDYKVVGLDAPESVVAKSANDLDKITEADYVVIGSGIGGLSAASMLAYYGYSVVVLESHYLPGGVAHTFEREGFHFDAGPSLWNGMATKPYNPLREVTTTLKHFVMKCLHVLLIYSL